MTEDVRDFLNTLPQRSGPMEDVASVSDEGGSDAAATRQLTNYYSRLADVFRRDGHVVGKWQVTISRACDGGRLLRIEEAAIETLGDSGRRCADGETVVLCQVS